MDKRRMILEATEVLHSSEDDGTEEPDALYQRVSDVVRSAWQDGMSLEGLIQAARRKLAAPES